MAANLSNASYKTPTLTAPNGISALPEPLALPTLPEVTALTTIAGTSGDDYLEGTAGDDTIDGGAGRDTIYGLAGNDILNGGANSDYISGGDGSDTYLFAKGGHGNDTIYDSGGNTDIVKFTDVASTDITGINVWVPHALFIKYGSNDQITIKDYFLSANRIEQFQFSDGVTWTWQDIKAKALQSPTEGDDLLIGDYGVADTIDGLAGNDEIFGFGGDDTLQGGAGYDKLHGNGGNDTLLGGDGADVIFGNSGDDILDGGTGDDRLEGGSGNDAYLFVKGDGANVIYDNHGSEDIVKFSNVASTDVTSIFPSNRTQNELTLVYGNGDKLTVDNYFSFYSKHEVDSIEQFQFSDGVTWNLQDIKDKLFPVTESDDVLLGSDAVDVINGLDGNDRIWRLNGDDSLQGDLGNDSIWGNTGDDTLLGGAGNDGLYGDNQESRHTPVSGGNDLLDGGEGDDLLVGYGGNDTLLGGAGNDRIYGDQQRLDLYAAGYGNDTIDGGAGGDYIRSGAGNDIINGGSGNDRIVNSAGNDIIDGGAGNDSIDDYGGNGTLYGAEGDDRILSVSVNSTIDGGLGNDRLVGLGLMIGGLGKDKILLWSHSSDNATVKIAAGDSLIDSNDAVFGFDLSNGISTTGIDRLDLDSTQIAADTAGLDGANVGIIKSHAIHDGIISFDNNDSYSNTLTLSKNDLYKAFKYLEANIGNGDTVAFTVGSNSYVFQDGGSADTLVRLVGVTATNLNTDGLAVGGVWLI